MKYSPDDGNLNAMIKHQYFIRLALLTTAFLEQKKLTTLSSQQNTAESI